jgi:hypothetical protein
VNALLKRRHFLPIPFRIKAKMIVCAIQRVEKMMYVATTKRDASERAGFALQSPKCSEILSPGCKKLPDKQQASINEVSNTVHNYSIIKSSLPDGYPFYNYISHLLK